MISAMREELSVSFHNDSYDIIISDSYEELTAYIDKLGFSGRRIAVITDSNVAPLYADKIKGYLEKVSSAVLILQIPAGEENKNLSEIEKLYLALIEAGFDRHDLLIALGGGVVGDMTGFCAATYLRGVSFIQLPTTLLAMADSSIGGKTGVDLKGYKNMVGAFHMPSLVYMNISVLETLPGIQFASGFAEIMKHGLIRDDSFYLWLLDNMYEIEEKDPETIMQMLVKSCSIKRDIVEKDPTEKADRVLLNFGHTIGHAIEKHKNFELLHGQCVALGCVAAAFISKNRNMISDEEYYEIRDMFVPFGLPITVEDVDIPEIVRLVHSDKKADAGSIRFILLKKLGKAVSVMDVSDEEIEAAVKEILWTEDGE